MSLMMLFTPSKQTEDCNAKQGRVGKMCARSHSRVGKMRTFPQSILIFLKTLNFSQILFLNLAFRPGRRIAHPGKATPRMQSVRKETFLID